ncbi:MAG: hypothetical protein H6744_16980 [Deltaproteobacteria bacterium]|nr:hypothetical protein [Deltaproteobacteria bacterium]MCB9788377.1 hypothetical protein [Deltaproteobacteria bacterium]
MGNETPRYDLIMVPAVRDTNVGEGAADSLIRVLATPKLVVPVAESLAETWCEVYLAPGPASHQLFVRGGYDGEEPVFLDGVVRWGSSTESLEYAAGDVPVHFFFELRGCLYDHFAASFLARMKDILFVPVHTFARPHAGPRPRREVPPGEERTDKRRKRGGTGALAGTRVEEL